MHLRTLVGTLLLSGLALLAPAQAVGAKTLSVPGKVQTKGELIILARVMAIDAQTRRLKVVSLDGQVQDIVMGPEARNFDKIKVGDEVTARIRQSLTLELLKGGAGTPERIDSTEELKVKQGSRASAGTTEKSIMIADVVAVDRAACTVLLKGKYRSMTLEVLDQAQLKLIEVGDRVKGTYEVALAVSVEPAKKP